MTKDVSSFCLKIICHMCATMTGNTILPRSRGYDNSYYNPSFRPLMKTVFCNPILERGQTTVTITTVYQINRVMTCAQDLIVSQAIVDWEPKEPLKVDYSLEEVEVYPPGEGDILVEVRAAGICHTDNLLSSVPRGTHGVLHPEVAGHEGTVTLPPFYSVLERQGNNK